MTRTLLALAALAASVSPIAAQDASPKWSLVIHGGAGTISRDTVTAEQEADISAALNEALDAGSAVLAAGGESIDAIEAAMMVLEDHPEFNAGRGAVFTWEGTNSLDASIMRGDTMAAGAVAGLSTSRNPILAARAVMEASPHVLLSGEGADTFATEQGIEQVDPQYFWTQRRWDALQNFKANAMATDRQSQLPVDYKFGTVGAVAMDVNGVVSAGTSTGGMTGKRWGRIGDSPIIGAGTYANSHCGLSATGTGEYFIRLAVAFRICNEVRLTSENAERKGQAITSRPGLAGQMSQVLADAVIDEVGELGGSGGVIMLAPDGSPIYAFDTPGMYRGHATSGGDRSVAMYGADD